MPTIGGRARDFEGTDHSHSSRSFALAVTLLVVVGGLVPIAIAHHFGAWGVPRGDDAAYVLSAFRFADTGKIDGNAWASMNLVGQLILSLPVIWLFGHRIAPLQIEVAALGVLGLCAVFDLARQLLSPRRALFVALLVAVAPMWMSLTTSYMTDVPTFALSMACLALGARAIRRDGLHVGFFCASLAAGFMAFTIREYAIIPLLAVGLAGIWAANRWLLPRLLVILVGLGGVVVLAALFAAWRRGLPGFANVTPQSPNLSWAKKTAHRAELAALVLGLLVSPAVLLAGPRLLVKGAWVRAPRTTVVVGLATILGLGAFLIQGRSAKFLEPRALSTDQWTIAGTQGDLFRSSLLVPLALVGLLSLAAIACCAVPSTVDALARARHAQLRSPELPARSIVAFATVGYIIAYVSSSALRIPFFNRYLLPLIPLVAILVLSSRAARGALSGNRLRRAASAGCVALAVLAAFGVVYAATSASFAGTAWSVARRASTVAKHPNQIDGGFAWNKSHAGFVLVRPPPAHPKNTCIALRAQTHPAGDGEGVLEVGKVWSATGTNVWILARPRRPC